MPDQLAHYLFGKRVLAAADRGLRSRVDPDSTAFRLGTFGPDPLFTDPNGRHRVEGFGLHRQPGFVALERMREAVRSGMPGAADYAAGFFTHYALDRLCHPELKAMDARGEAKHLPLEAAYDWELYHRNAMELPKRIFPSEADCRAAIQMYHSLTPHQYRADVRVYWALRRALVLQKGRFLASLPGKLSLAWDGIIPHAEPSEGIRRGIEMLDGKLRDCVSEAAEQLQRYFSAIDADAPLDRWTKADFAGREHDPALQKPDTN